MRKRILVLSLILFLCNFNIVKASSINDLNIDSDTVLYNGDEYLSIRESPNSSSREIGVLKKNSSAKRLDESDGDWIKVISGDITGWIFEPYTISGEDLNNYVNNNIKLFDVKAQVKSTTGAYTSVDNLKEDYLSYLTKVSFKDDNTKIYKTNCISSKIEDENSYYEAIRVNDELVKIRKEANGKSDCLRYADLDEEFKVIEKVGKWYKVKLKNSFGYISQSKCDVFIRHPKISNIADVSYTKNTMYEALEMGEGIVKVIIDGKDYYVDENDVYVFYIQSQTSKACSIASRNSEYDLSAIGVKNNVYRVKKVNLLTGTNVDIYIDADDAELAVDFDEAEAVEVQESESENNDDSEEIEKGINFISKETKSKYKSKYEYEYDNGSTDERNEIINYALSFLGNPYLYGGTDLYNGIDCSAFCQKILKNFGKKIGRCTSDQVSESYGSVINPDELQPGDLIYYTKNGRTPYHVVMYLGGDKCVNASCRRWGICISTVEKDRILMMKNYID